MRRRVYRYEDMKYACISQVEIQLVELNDINENLV